MQNEPNLNPILRKTKTNQTKSVPKTVSCQIFTPFAQLFQQNQESNIGTLPLKQHKNRKKCKLSSLVSRKYLYVQFFFQRNPFKHRTKTIKKLSIWKKAS